MGPINAGWDLFRLFRSARDQARARNVSRTRVSAWEHWSGWMNANLKVRVSYVAADESAIAWAWRMIERLDKCENNANTSSECMIAYHILPTDILTVLSQSIANFRIVVRKRKVRHVDWLAIRDSRLHVFWKILWLLSRVLYSNRVPLHSF